MNNKIEFYSNNDFEEARKILNMKYKEIVAVNEVYEEEGKIYADGHFMTDIENDIFDTECLIADTNLKTNI